MASKAIIVLLISLFSSVKGQQTLRTASTTKDSTSLRCYACSFSYVDTDKSCLTVTNKTMSVVCPYKYCTVQRQEYIDPSGVTASFMRGCSERPDYLNHEIVDGTFKTYYRACTNDYCNTGDGIQLLAGGHLIPDPQKRGPNLLVPGTGGGAIP